MTGLLGLPQAVGRKRHAQRGAACSGYREHARRDGGRAVARPRPDLDGPGVYLLIGPTESGLPPSRVYIGETDDLPGRLDNHNRNKDFWNRAIVFTSKDANLNKAHIRYLEARLIGLAQAAKRAELDNGTVGSLPPLSEPDTAEAEAFLAEEHLRADLYAQSTWTL